jgi:TRAP-type uncharacterized transport system substrate-binding protein
MASPPPKSTYAPSPWLVELAAMKPVHLLSFPERYVRKAEQATGLAMLPITLPPEVLPVKETAPWECLSLYMTWGAHEDMPDDIVTEILRIAYDKAEKFVEYNPRGGVITKQTMATMGSPENLVHPAALKFYKEKGLSITTFK